VSVRDIAQASGLSNAVLYYHFGSKRNLYFEVLREHISTLSLCLQEAGAIDGSCRERLANIAQAYTHMIIEYQDTVQIMLRDLAQFDWEEVLLMLPDFQTQIPSAITAALELGMARGEVRSVDAQRVGVLFLGMISSLAASRARPPGVTTALDNDVDLVVDVLFEGIQPFSPTKEQGEDSA
jgi:AcrR family transcriptional regulator